LPLVGRRLSLADTRVAVAQDDRYLPVIGCCRRAARRFSCCPLRAPATPT